MKFSPLHERVKLNRNSSPLPVCHVCDLSDRVFSTPLITAAFSDHVSAETWQDPLYQGTLS